MFLFVSSIHNIKILVYIICFILFNVIVFYIIYNMKYEILILNLIPIYKILISNLPLYIKH